MGNVFNMTGSGEAGIRLAGIAVTTPPAKTSYLSGERFDPTGMVVTATYSNGAQLAATGYTMEPDGPLTDGITYVMIRYTEGGRSATATQAVTVLPVLRSIAVTTPPARTEYRYGDSFDPAGMAVTASYSDGSAKVVIGYTTSPAAFAALGEQSVTVEYSEDGISVSAATPVTVSRAVIAALPAQRGALTYDGNPQTPAWDGYDSAKMTLAVEAKINAGSYSTSFTPTGNYEWWDGSVEAKTASWRIGKASNTIALSSTSLTLNASSKTGKVTVTRKGDGAISATSSNTGVATVESINQTTGEITISSVDDTTGTATITVSVAEGSNYLAAEDKTFTVKAVFREYLYGYDINLADQNPATRVSYPVGVDNYGFTPAVMNFSTDTFSYGSWPSIPGEKFMPRPCMLKFDGTADYYLNPDDYTKKADGSASDVANINYGGNAMIEWPKIYTKRWESGGVYHFRCSDMQVDSEYECWCNYDKNNNEIPHFYTGCFDSSKDSSGRMRSISGQDNMAYIYIPELFSAAKLNGEDIWHISVFSDLQLINDLLVMMFARTDLQEAAGYGHCKESNSGTIKPGTMNTKGMFWGSNDMTSGVKVFGMENRWGNSGSVIAGWILINNKHKVKVTRGTKDGTTVSDYNVDGSGYLETGVTLTGADGYISTMETEQYGRLPSATSGSNTTYEADYAFLYRNSIGCAFVGGNYSMRQFCGPFCVNLNINTRPSVFAATAFISCKPLAPMQS